jgi:hypothetical protein
MPVTLERRHRVHPEDIPLDGVIDQARGAVALRV